MTTVLNCNEGTGLTFDEGLERVVMLLGLKAKHKWSKDKTNYSIDPMFELIGDFLLQVKLVSPSSKLCFVWFNGKDFVSLKY